MSIRSAYRIYLAAGLVSVAIILVRYFKIPYPFVVFLEYDVSGVPLGVLALISLRLAVSSLPVYYVVPVALGSDLIGMAMKCLAEASTFTPLALVARKLGLHKGKSILVLSVLASAASRVLVMSLANYFVTPHWLVWAGWIKDYEKAYTITLTYLPHVAFFNLTVALIVTPLALVAYQVLKRAGLA